MYMNRMKMKEKRWYKNRGTVELGLASFSWKQIADESKCVKNNQILYLFHYCVINLKWLYLSNYCLVDVHQKFKSIYLNEREVFKMMYQFLFIYLAI